MSDISERWDAIQNDGDPSSTAVSNRWERAQKGEEEPKKKITEEQKKEMPWHERAIQGLRDPSNAVVQLLLHSPMGKAHLALTEGMRQAVGAKPTPESERPAAWFDQAVSDQEKEYQAKRGGDAGIDWVRAAGNIASPINWVAPGGAEAGLLARTGMNALRGAATAAMTSPVTEGEFLPEKAKQTALGAVGGAALTPVAAGLARVVQPRTHPAAQALLNQGVTPTSGQILGGTAQRLEDAATSVPVLGDFIKKAQGRAIGQFNTAAYQRALDPIGEKAPAIVGREGVEQVANTLGKHYDEVLSQITFRPDKTFGRDLQGLKHLADNLPEQQAKQFDNILKAQLGKATKSGTMDGETLKGVLSEVRREAKGYSGDVSFDNRKLGAALDELHGTISRTLQRINPDKATELKALDTGWANYARIRQAASAVGAHEGVFTPSQLHTAVKALDRSVGKGDFAKGKALMQDLSEAGKTALSQKVPDSGTALRAMLNVGAGGGAAWLAQTHPLIAASSVAGIGLGSAAYTKPGQKALSVMLTKRPDMAPYIADAVRRGLPLTAGPGSGLLLRDVQQ